jgi:hypothetical protein
MKPIQSDWNWSAPPAWRLQTTKWPRALGTFPNYRGLPQKPGTCNSQTGSWGQVKPNTWDPGWDSCHTLEANLKQKCLDAK